MNKNPIDVSYTDVNKKYYAIDKVADILKIDQSKIIFYFEKLNDFLNIKSVGMYQLFDDTDVKNLKRIRDLESNQHMSMKEIKKYLIQNKQEILLEKEPNNQVDQSVLNIFQQFANALMEQNMKIDEMNKTNIQLVNIINTLSTNQEKIQQEQKDSNEKLIQQFETIKKEIATDIGQKFEEQGKEFKNGLNCLDNKITERDVKIVEDLSRRLEQRKKESEDQSNQSFFSKLFHKKK